MKKGFLKKTGFTLIELLVVIAVIAILSSIGFFAFSSAQQTARDARRRSDIKTLQTAAEQYYSVNTKYPNTEELLSENLPQGIPVDPSTKIKYVYGGSGTSGASLNGYCFCALLEKTGKGNSTGHSGISCNFNPAGGDYFCAESVQ